MSLSSLSVILAVWMMALPASFSPLNTRDTNSTTPKVNFKITDHDGTDVTRAFKIMLYDQAQPQATNKLNDRQVPFVRPINTCEAREGIFVDSECNHKELDPNSLKSYTYRCLSYVQGDTAPPRFARRVILPFTGECHEDEICVNGRGGNELWNEHANVANCVKSAAYSEVSNASDPTNLDKYLSDQHVEATLSDLTAKTSLKADSINMEAEVSGLGGAKGSKQSKSCIDCVDLSLDKLAPKTDVLETDVKLLTAGTMVAGILWLTILSG